MWNHHCSDREGRGWRAWQGFDADFAAFFGGGGGSSSGTGSRRRRGFGGGRMFDQGDLKLVILRLLDEKPRHGYEIIKELEERSSGCYTPSAGAVYPTLTMLEDLGYAEVTPEEGGKKVYTITEAGRAHLAEHRPAVDELFERVNQFGDAVFGDGVRPARDAMIALAKEFGSAMMSGRRTPEQVAKIREILDRATEELKAAAR